MFHRYVQDYGLLKLFHWYVNYQLNVFVTLVCTGVWLNVGVSVVCTRSWLNVSISLVCAWLCLNVGVSLVCAWLWLILTRRYTFSH